MAHVAQLFKRLVYHLKHQEMLAEHSVKHKLAKELQRPVNQPAVPDQPTEQEVMEHNATHIPYKLFMHDRSTKMMHAVPTPAKGGRSLPYLTLTWLGHQEVCLRTDNESSAVSLLESCRKALKGLGVHTTVELLFLATRRAMVLLK